MKDEVNSPEHYTSGSIECINAIEAALTPEEFRGFLKGNIIKYTWRERLKGGAQSLAKAKWYLTRLISNMSGAPLPTIHNHREMDHAADAVGFVKQSGIYEADAFDQIEAHHFWKERA